MDDGPSTPRPTPASLPVLPWARLFRAVGVSLDARKLILAALGLLLARAGWLGLDAAFGAGAEPLTPGTFGLRLDLLLGAAGPPEALLLLVAEPFRHVVAPFARLFRPGVGTIEFLHALLAGVWGVIVWGLVGGAIARVAAVQVAAGERIGLGTALRFALSRSLPLIVTPLSPFLGVGLFAALCALLGLLYRIPGPVGATIVGVLAFLPLLAGLVMALILLGAAAGWPLMVATVAAEGEDGFDALSRSYSYVFQRPGRYAGYALLSWAVGVVGAVFVLLFAGAVLHLAAWGLAFGGPDARVWELFDNPTADGGGTAVQAHALWRGFVGLLAHGWIYSYFWSAATMIYLLLRRDVDGTPWHDVYLPGQEADEFAPGPATAGGEAMPAPE